MTKPDLSEFEALAKPKRPPCRVADARESLDADDREKFDAALSADKSQINSGAIVEWLKRRDLTASAVGVANHRNGICSCQHADV